MQNKNIERLLFINPTIEQKSNAPVNDIYVEAMEWAFSLAQKGTANFRGTLAFFHNGSCYRGFHKCCDGESSTNFDYLLETPEGYVVNSLSVHYLRWFRDAIPQEDWVKLDNVKAYYKQHMATKNKKNNLKKG